MAADDNERVPDKEIAQTASVSRPLRKGGDGKLFLGKRAWPQHLDTIPLQKCGEVFPLLHALFA